MNELLDYAGADGLIISKPKEKFGLQIKCTETYCKDCIYLCKKTKLCVEDLIQTA